MHWRDLAEILSKNLRLQLPKHRIVARAVAALEAEASSRCALLFKELAVT